MPKKDLITSPPVARNARRLRRIAWATEVAEEVEVEKDPMLATPSKEVNATVDPHADSHMKAAEETEEEAAMMTEDVTTAVVGMGTVIVTVVDLPAGAILEIPAVEAMKDAMIEG